MFELAAEAVVPRLRGRFGRPYQHVERCRSTQLLLTPDAPEGAVVVAEEQTSGRGRLGRRWEAAPGTSILCSISLRPAVDAEVLPHLSLVAGAACAEAMAVVTGLHPTVKFPNDILVSGRKVAGILAEASGGWVVLGIGINVNAQLEELPEGATSLSRETGRPVDRAELLITLLERLETHYDRWTTSPSSPP
jgi:BirA family biotin operon repressor/biotin-[acetyl-CoA-carboxylase] ligase